MRSSLLSVALAVALVGCGSSHPVRYLTPCVAEDSPGPCVWNATERGNGHGRSFYRDADGAVHYLGVSS